MTNQVTKNHPQPLIPTALEHRYDRFLGKLSFLPSLKGYAYMKQAIYYEQKNRHLMPSLTKEIYDEIARVYRTQIPAVERCITFSMKKAYRQNPDAFLQFFPDCNKVPSNFRFIKTVALLLNYAEE